jgi:hypothetical protein
VAEVDRKRHRLGFAAAVGRQREEIIVIDTDVSRSSTSVFEVDSLYDPEKVVDHRLVLIPSRDAVAELAAQFGFDTVTLAQNMTDYTGMLTGGGRRTARRCRRPAHRYAGRPRRSRGEHRRQE